MASLERWDKLLAYCILHNDEFAVVWAQRDYLQRTGEEPTAAMVREFERMEHRSAMRLEEMRRGLELPLHPEMRIAPVEDVIGWYKRKFGLRRAIGLWRILRRFWQ